MHEEKEPSERGYARYPSKDITPILKGWEHEAGTINVRRIVGLDGAPKLQMRLDLGLMQMEMDGRPDGRRPHGCESLLEYFEKRMREYRRKNGNEMGFHLTPAQCQSLREEALMYYHRYLGLFVLGEYPAVARDTQRNLRVLDLCSRYAVDDQDRLVLEQYRPYILMMHTRSLASIDYNAGNYKEAMAIVKNGLKDLKSFFHRFGQDQAYKHASEVRMLKRFGREICDKLPIDPVRKLSRELERAVKFERYEEAARLRDEIERLKPGEQQA